jgi:adenylate cyclase
MKGIPMANEGFKRKLAAILSADAVGYSRLMRDDEEATVRDIAAHRVLISDIIQQHHGRVVDSPGDNMLAEFASVVDAVNGAIKIQEKIKKSNADTPKDRRMEFRIGINLGDVIEEEEQIYGDGVNIAARVEGLAAGGGIAISGIVYDSIKDKVSLGYHYLGEQDVKNIPEPVRVYRLLTEPDDAGKMIGEEMPKSSKSRYIAFGALGLIILAVGIFVIWNNYFRAKIEPASVEKMAYSLPDKPSIAVLPLINLSGDPEQEHLSDGFTEDIITTLAKMPRMFVIARESSFIYKGKSVKTQEVGRDLGVRYVVEGSIQKSGERIRITAQLIDAANGHHLWAEKYDRNLTDIFALKDEITKEIAIALQIKLTEGEWLSGWGSKTNNFDAWLKVKQSLEHFRHFTPDGNILSRKKAKEALNLDPNYTGAMQMVAWTLLMDGLFGTSKTPDKSIEQAFELAQKALDKGDDDPGAHYLLGYAHSQRGQFEIAVSELEIARDLFPNSAEINAGLGMVLVDAGRPIEAIPVFKKAMRLNPIPPSWYFANLGDAYRNTEQYEKATLEYKKAIQQQPDQMLAHLSLAVCYVRLNRQEDAYAEAAEVLKINPKFSVERFAKNLHFKDQAAKQRRIDVMRKAGLPE